MAWLTEWGVIVSEKKQIAPPDSFTSESFSAAGLREQVVKELRVRIERFCEQASPEEIIELTRIVRSLLAARGLLPEQTSKRIN